MFLTNCLRFLNTGLRGSSLLKTQVLPKQATQATQVSDQGILGLWSLLSVRFKANVKMHRGRNYRPNLYKRQKKFGMKTRMSTEKGQVILMRRMMKKGVSYRTWTV